MGSGGGLGRCVFRYGKHACTKNVVGFSWVWMPTEGPEMPWGLVGGGSKWSTRRKGEGRGGAEEEVISPERSPWWRDI